MTKNKLTGKIEKTQVTGDADTRDYIGASIIGSDCLRQIWYELKGTKGAGVSAKIQRTWDIGKRLESLVIRWLTDAGFAIEITNKDLVSEKVTDFKGHVDALIKLEEEVFILEIKTAKDASYGVFAGNGLKIWNPQYYAQIQSYMGMSGIHGAFIIVLNKDNSDLCDEWISFDDDFYKKLEEKALFISQAVTEPPRISGSPLWYKCKLCKFNKVCHE